MQLTVVVLFAILFFVAFSIGLNLGLHGVISLHGSPSPGSEAKVKSAAAASVALSTTSLDSTFLRETPCPTHAPSFSATLAATFSPTPPPSVTSISQMRTLVDQTSVESDAYKQSVTTMLSDEKFVSKEKSPIARFLKAGGKLPIVLLTCNRAELLKQTLASLFSVRGVSKKNVLVIQDGNLPSVAQVVRDHGISLIQNTESIVMRGEQQPDGAERIAKHYKFSLTAAFERHPDAPAIIIIEDDLLFAPDFYEYFEAVSPVLNADPSLFVISAWNDNGFKGKVSDPFALVRTEFFPGLGWLLPRDLYKNELENKWPRAHWDHWLRSFEIHRQREVVHPQVPRSYHNGIKGTFMDLATHNRYFRDIDYNTDSSITWKKHQNTREEDIFIGAMSSVYEVRIEQLMSKCTHVNTFSDLITKQGGILCVWVSCNPEPPAYSPPDFEPIAKFFGLWHEVRRGGHRGLHEFYWEDSYILLINVFDVVVSNTNILMPTYKLQKPPSVPILTPNVFDKRLITELKRKKMGLVGTPSSSVGKNCDEVCAEENKVCRKDLLPLLNTCQALNEVFPCRDCSESRGLEQPAYVDPTAEAKHSPGRCLVNSSPEYANQVSCSATHPATKRLCACA